MLRSCSAIISSVIDTARVCEFHSTSWHIRICFALISCRPLHIHFLSNLSSTTMKLLSVFAIAPLALIAAQPGYRAGPPAPPSHPRGPHDDYYEPVRKGTQSTKTLYMSIACSCPSSIRERRTPHKPQTTNHKPQTTNHKPQTTVYTPQRPSFHAHAPRRSATPISATSR